MDQPAIVARNLTKKYGRVTAVDAINLSIAKGEVFGLLGPNGSGKTTTILMIMGLTDITKGRVEVLGLDPVRQPLEVKRRIGYMPDSVGFYDDLTARQNLRYSGRLAGIEAGRLEERIGTVLDQIGLAEVGDHRVATFSQGMRQRLGLADALLKEPQLVILDEPTNGLDPQATHEFLGLITGLKQQGISVLLSSHMLDRVQTVCDRVALFRRGRLALLGTVTELAQQVLGSGYRILVDAEGKNLERALAGVGGVRAVTGVNGHFELDTAADIRAEAADAVRAAGGRLLGLSARQPSLDEVYNRYFTEASDAA